jgi:DNA-binding LacI/PurR family transcriptional regulator
MSKTTVSDALAGNGRLMQETRDIVLQAAKDLNYRAHPHAQSLRKKNSGEVLLVSGSIDLGVSTRKITQIQIQLSANGYSSPIYAYSQDGDNKLNQSNLLESVARIQPRAVVCNALTLDERSREILLALQSQGVVVVCYDAELTQGDEMPELDQVIFDRADNTYQATRHLLELGHRDIGLVSFSNSPTMPIRLRGFERALEERGLSVRPEWIFSRATNDSAEFTEILGAQAADYFLGQDKRPTGYFVVSDLAALAFMGQMGRAGVRIPDDISVIGHDNMPICEYVSVRLSSVSHPVDLIAQTVVDRVVARLLNPDLKPDKIWVRGQVEARASTAAPPSP